MRKSRDHSDARSSRRFSGESAATGFKRIGSVAGSQGLDRSASMMSTASKNKVDRRQHLDMKRKIEQLKGKINDVKAKLEQGEVSLSETRAQAKAVEFKLTSELNAQSGQLQELQRYLNVMEEREAAVDAQIDCQTDELRTLEHVVDHLKLKFIHAFLTNSYDVGVKVSHTDIFNQEMPPLEKPSEEQEEQNKKAEEELTLSPQLVVPPNIVTPILQELREQLEELLQVSMVDVLCADTSRRVSGIGSMSLAQDEAEMLATLQAKSPTNSLTPGVGFPEMEEDEEEPEDTASGNSVCTDDLFAED